MKKMNLSHLMNVSKPWVIRNGGVFCGVSSKSLFEKYAKMKETLDEVAKQKKGPMVRKISCVHVM